MTIEIVTSELQTDDRYNTPDIWHCELEITNASTTYAWSATAPGTLAVDDLQVHFNAIEPKLWAAASFVQQNPDAYARVKEKRIIKALALVMLSEINTLRAQHGLAERTPAQLENAIKAIL